MESLNDLNAKLMLKVVAFLDFKWRPFWAEWLGHDFCQNQQMFQFYNHRYMDRIHMYTITIW